MPANFMLHSVDKIPMTESSHEKNSPRLSHRGLTMVLVFMCVIPLITIFTLFQILPPVEEGTLEASVAAEGLPDAPFYEIAYDQRPPFTGGVLMIKNLSKQDWTHLNIQVNRHYQIYDVEPIPAGGTSRFDLDRFVSRTGARFNPRYNPLKSIRIYARRPTKDRATYYYEF